MKIKERFKFNLQLFATEMGAEPGAADPVGIEPAPAPEGTEPAPADKDPAKAFAARLGHERKKMESEYSPYKSVIERQAKASGMTSQEYLSFLQEKQLEEEAEAAGKTPAEIRLAQEKKEVEDRLAQYERKEKLSTEEKEIVSDPKVGKFAGENLERLKEIVESADVDYRTALAIVAAEKLPDLIKASDPETHKEKILKEYLDSIKRGGKPVEIGGGSSASPTATAPKSFDDARKAALERMTNAK